MANIARHQEMVFPGMSDVLKEMLRGRSLDQFEAPIKAVPDYDQQQLLLKVSDQYLIYFVKMLHSTLPDYERSRLKRSRTSRFRKITH